MSDFEKNERRQFELGMRPVADKLYREIIPGICSIQRFEKSDERHILDREYAIDVEFKLSEAKLTCQEKFRSSAYLKYNDITVEYYNDPALKFTGDWFNLCSQLYFCGYASADKSRFEKWVMLDWVRVVLETYKGNIFWRTKQNLNSKANFNYAAMSAIPQICVIASFQDR